ncbi:hypothetical protein ABTX81_12605 [Kitasatospora sp. NPDC097605]|uniref:hypothetical protein n=1 Tax=Kitasatospora sp. NPDC097605 TaxID=3157226 RepID=UPI003325C1F8
MRSRTLTALSALTALTLLGMVPVAQAAGSAAPSSSTEVKPAPDTAQTGDTARAGAAVPGPTLQNARALCYQAHSRNAGWTSVLCTDGAAGFTGTTGQNDPIDRVYFSVYGDLDFNVQLHWSNDGTGAERRVAPGTWAEIYNPNGNALEAIHLRSTNETMKAAAHVQNVGWKGTDLWSYDQWIGSIGEARWMEAFWVAI